MTITESKAINSIRFLCIIFLVLLHTQVLHLTDPSITEPLTKTQKFLSIPFLQILFLLSGYLFFHQKDSNTQQNWILKIWPQKLKKRVKTLLIPYILWCLIALIYNHFVKNIEFPCDLLDFLRQFWNAADGHPIGKAVWYIKSLIIFSVFAPLYYYFIKYLKHFTLLILLLPPSLGIAIDFPYFNIYLLLGAYLSIMGFSFYELTNKLNYQLCLIIYIAIKIVRLYFDIPDINIYFDFILCFVGLLGLLMRHNIPTVLAVSSSFIYFVHPYLTGVRNIYIQYADSANTTQCLLTWIASAITVFTACLILFFILKYYTPKILRILTGDRI